MTPVALILDFDGTTVDTEWPVFDMVRGVYRAHGLEIDISQWVDKLGRAEAAGSLERLELPLLPGALQLMDAADRAGVPMAVASSSSSAWVDSHLERLAVAHRFAAVRTRDHVVRAKPAPDLFLAAAAALCRSRAVSRCGRFPPWPPGSTSRRHDLCCRVQPNHPCRPARRCRSHHRLTDRISLRSFSALRVTEARPERI